MKKEFLVDRQGKTFALYAGLLDQAHQEGLKRITTRLEQIPSDANGQVAICYAEVETAKGVFSGIGDACAGNVGRMIAAHTIRMSETRAKARALRDAINVGVAAVEELGDEEEEVEKRPATRPPATKPPAPVSAPPAVLGGPDDPAPTAWYAQLRDLAGQAQIATGELVRVPDKLTIAAARELKARLVAALAEQHDFAADARQPGASH